MAACGNCRHDGIQIRSSNSVAVRVRRATNTYKPHRWVSCIVLSMNVSDSLTYPIVIAPLPLVNALSFSLLDGLSGDIHHRRSQIYPIPAAW